MLTVLDTGTPQITLSHIFEYILTTVSLLGDLH